jgi:alpha-L-fucosidase 2
MPIQLRSLLRRTGSAVTAGLLVSAGLTAIAAQPAMADPVTSTEAARIVQQYTGVWTTPPTQLSNGETTDAPLMGNGNVGVAVGGSINDQTFYLGKNDFFSAASHAIEPLDRIVVAAPSMAGASYHVVQNIAQAQVLGTYTLGSATLATTSWVSATQNTFAADQPTGSGGYRGYIDDISIS